MTQNKFKRAVVTGGLGFIGSHLVDDLLRRDVQVVAIDNLATGRRSNLKQNQGNTGLSILEADLADARAIAPAFVGADVVYHLGAMADIVPSMQKPALYFHANVTGTMNVMEAARAAGVRKVVYAASSSCYGIPDETPTPETADIRPEYPYALTKNLGEQIVLHWGKIYKMNVVSTRFFNVFGPRARTSGTYGAVFGVFLAQKLSGQPLTIVGDGSQTRDFTFVSDIVDAVVLAANADVSGEIFNVGTSQPQSVAYLAKLLGGPVINIPKRPGEPDCTWADISKIQRVLGWKPRVSFEQGVKIMLEHIEDWRDAPVWTPEKITDATRDWFTYLSK